MKKEYYYLLGGLAVGFAASFLYAKNKFETTTSSESGSNLSGRKASESGLIAHGKYRCMDGNRPCNWQGNYCPCSLVL